MNWKLASTRALEMVAWSSAPVAALGAHHAVWMKFAFVQQHQFVMVNVLDGIPWTEEMWKLGEKHYGWLCLAALLIPVLCSFLQHLGLRWWSRSLIGIAVCSPVLWYTSVALQLFGKVITQASY